MIRYLFDEHIPHSYPMQIRRLTPELPVRTIGEPGTPLWGTSDPDILLWCEQHGFILVTNNRASMPIHLRDHLAQGRHVPGIFIINPGLALGKMIEELVLIAGASFTGEYTDRVEFLPLT